MRLGTILSSFAAALTQLGDRRFARVFWVSVGLALALLVGATAGFVALLQGWLGDTITLPLLGPVTWIGDLVTWSGLFLMLVLSVFLMVPVASAITSMFLDTVADAVEARYYPRLGPATPLPMSEALKDTVNFLGLLIAANTVAFLAYVMLPFVAVPLFWALNGLLLGREYSYLAVMRREGRAGARAFWARHRGTLWLAGVLMAMPLSVPVVNLAVPILGAATFTHLYHRLR